MPNKKTQEWIPWEMRRTNPDIFYLKNDGIFPNSVLPVLIYRGVFRPDYECCSDWLEEKFLNNKWSKVWKKTVRNYDHYYTNVHQVIGVCGGEGEMHMGGKFGISAKIEKGDIVVIPAGVTHRCESYSDDFDIVGAFSSDIDANLVDEGNNDLSLAEQLIKETVLPIYDPILGEDGALLQIWKS